MQGSQGSTLFYDFVFLPIVHFRWFQEDGVPLVIGPMGSNPMTLRSSEVCFLRRLLEGRSEMCKQIVAMGWSSSFRALFVII